MRTFDTFHLGPGERWAFVSAIAYTIVNITLRGERKLGKHWGLFAEYEYEQSLSNRALDEYRASRVSGGVDVEF